MKFSHPLSNYGLACVLLENGLSDPEQIQAEHLIKVLENNLGHFKIFTREDPKIHDELEFRYAGLKQLEEGGDLANKKAAQGVYIAPHVITTDKSAALLWKAILEKIALLKNPPAKGFDLNGLEGLTSSLVPMSGKFNNGKTSQTYPKASNLEILCSAITTTTPNKPALAVDLTKSISIIPDLPPEKALQFIKVFKWLEKEQQGLWKSKVNPSKRQYLRPKLFEGNFPDAPPSRFFKTLGLLASLGKWANEAEDIPNQEVLEVLDTLKNCTFYLVSQATNTSIEQYGHFIVELAKRNKLGKIIQGLLNVNILSVGKRWRGGKSVEAKFDLFDFHTTRFLQAFDRPSFRDFLATRAEYPSSLTLLFHVFFTQAEDMNIPKEIVESAKNFGSWINYLAYRTAKASVSGDNREAVQEQKAKILIELESAVFAAKTPTALLAQLLTRIGRLSNSDAPNEAQVFAKAVMLGEISLDDAKNMLIAFARISNYEASEKNQD
jgi:hypothetical protein